MRAKRWDCELDISAPQFILAEDFSDPTTMMVVFDLGHLHFHNKAAGMEPKLPTAVEQSEDTDGNDWWKIFCLLPIKRFSVCFPLMNGFAFDFLSWTRLTMLKQVGSLVLKWHNVMLNNMGLKLAK